MMEYLNSLIEHFGYFGIILALFGGIVGLPIPDEVLLTYVGYTVFAEQMVFLPSLFCAFIGACSGITISFILGIKLGIPFLHKFGPKIHITETRVERTRILFNKLGPFLLFIGFFIPGVRHITAYLAGINRYSYKKFTLFAYLGAAIWCFTFITLGRLLGENWMHVEAYLSRYSIYLILLLLLGFIIIYSYRRKKRILKNASS
ncbi:DedA family protein [Neobacillus sp. MM2021_6]|uniref:DedA family protein n=1 Tax=Bacillaceae TaxID=186817 RepID=UPI00140AF0E0|nr:MULTISPECIES: DedA family protein [Bacillaceae]MBO0962728.1 DedA family protein [Neobacillus sp. MM2021_6]NHC20371.1 DedA family protein [Bacillus sp. MM2020_4]